MPALLLRAASFLARAAATAGRRAVSYASRKTPQALRSAGRVFTNLYQPETTTQAQYAQAREQESPQSTSIDDMHFSLLGFVFVLPLGQVMAILLVIVLGILIVFSSFNLIKAASIASTLSGT